MQLPEFDHESVRQDFPILKRTIGDKPLSYLDSAATAQKPQAVIDALNVYYSNENSNIHRGVHHLSEMATNAYESVRQKVASFIGANDIGEVVFTRGATESINLIAHGFVESVLNEGDEILITHMEHHANIVPWQIAAEKTGAVLKVVPVLEDGTLDVEAVKDLINEKTKLFAFVHTSNMLGTINPVEELIKIAKGHNVPVLLDGCQSVPHEAIDLKNLGCDFFVFSGHKLFGPTGVGILWAKREWLERFPPYQSGGDMIELVDFEGTTFKGLPGKFEAGTPHIAGVIGLGAAIDYLAQIDRVGAMHHEQKLLEAATQGLLEFPDAKIFGTAKNKAAILSFKMGDIHAHDIGTFLNADGVAIRAGHHCTQPLLKRFGVPATARASFSFYNNFDDVQRFIEALKKMQRFFG